jgi:fumarate reductase subunit D
MRRSNEPIFWSLFGAGGMLSALVGPVLIFITGFAVPLGVLLPHETMDYAHLMALTRHPLGKLVVLVVISLFLFHGCHRMLHSLHDLGVHTRNGSKVVFYGFAVAGTAITAALLFAIGF